MMRTFLLSIPKQTKRKNGTNTIHIILSDEYSIYFIPTTIAGGRALSHSLTTKDMCIGLNLSENPIRRWYAFSIRTIDQPTDWRWRWWWRRRRQRWQRRRQNKSKTSNENISSTSILLQDQEHWKYAISTWLKLLTQWPYNFMHSQLLAYACIGSFYIPFARLLSPVRYAAFNKVELCVWMLCNVYLVPAACCHRRRRRSHHLFSMLSLSLSPTLNRTVGCSLDAYICMSLCERFNHEIPLYSWANL